MEESFGMQDYSDNEPVYSLDPVCGTKVDEEKAAAKIDYAGVTYYFCSRDCEKAFEEEPAKYMGRRVA